MYSTGEFLSCDSVHVTYPHIHRLIKQYRRGMLPLGDIIIRMLLPYKLAFFRVQKLHQRFVVIHWSPNQEYPRRKQQQSKQAASFLLYAKMPQQRPATYRSLPFQPFYYLQNCQTNLCNLVEARPRPAC